MRSKGPRTCTYVVHLRGSADEAELREVASYLSTLSLAGCDVLILDPTTGGEFEQGRRILRWVGRHRSGRGDVLQISVNLAQCEKVIVAAPESRYTEREIAAVLSLLDRFEVVEPGEFVAPLPWWGGVDAGHLLLQRGLERMRGTGSTFAFRRSAWRPLIGLGERMYPDLRRLIIQGAEVQRATDVFVRREPPPFATWIRLRVHEAAGPGAVTGHSALLACLLPLLMILAALGGLVLAAGYAGVVALAAVLLAVRGRSGAARYFPVRACLFAPLSILGRSIGVYWSLFARMRPDNALSAQRSGAFLEAGDASSSSS